MSFFSPLRRFAVVGASSNPEKYGYKVLEWYKSRELLVTPVNPKGEEILGLKSFKSLKEVLDSSSDDFSVSVITPPRVSLSTLEEVGTNPRLKWVWFQPGSYDKKVIEYCQHNKLNVIYRGHCILVEGDFMLEEGK